jgi:hypothetical protein
MTAGSYTIEFMDASPTTIECRQVAVITPDAVEVPRDAMQFAFYDSERKWIAPHYFVTNDAEFGTLDDLASRFPNSPLHAPNGEEVPGSCPCALVTWDHPEGSQWMGSMVVPLVDGVTAVFHRADGVIWPKPEQA